MRDWNPIVESGIGFIDSFLDPLRNRSEWKGFVLLLNKRKEYLSHIFASRAKEFYKEMPWNRDYEREEYEKPDFADYKVLTHASSGIPKTLVLPNY